MSKRRGFSLGEVTVSLLILSVLSVVLVGVIPSTLFAMRENSQRLVASQIADGEIESARILGTAVTPHPIPKTVRNGIEYWGELRTLPSQTGNGQPIDPKLSKTVEVEVIWNTTGGKERRYKIRSLIVKQI